MVLKVSTVEHLLAAFYITGIDNALIEIDNEEVPIMDGSSKDFLHVLEKSSLINQSKKRKYLKIKKNVELLDGIREKFQSNHAIIFRSRFSIKL